MYNHDIDLIKHKITKDEIGNDIKEEVKTNVLCKVASIGQNEFYNASMIDLKPEIKFIMHEFEYSGEKEVEFKGNRYKIIRTYYVGKGNNSRRVNKLEFDEIELTCERVISK